MESSKFGYWLQIGANVGILAGLILVGLQINQNTELTRMSIFSAEQDGYLSMGGVQSGETLAVAWAKAIDEPESLTTAEMVQLAGYLENMLVQLSRRASLHLLGLYEESAQQQIEWLIDDYFGNAFARAWWQERKKTWKWRRLGSAVDRAIAALDDNKQSQEFDSIRRTIAERATAAAE